MDPDQLAMKLVVVDTVTGLAKGTDGILFTIKRAVFGVAVPHELLTVNV